jgi:hypothetical protein
VFGCVNVLVSVCGCVGVCVGVYMYMRDERSRIQHSNVKHYIPILTSTFHTLCLRM